MKNELIIQQGLQPSAEVISSINRFLELFKPIELLNEAGLLLLFDKKSEAFYLNCHLESKMISSKTDLQAVLDADESEDYKLNREIYVDNYAYKRMEEDAIAGRSFEDLVVEFDETYRHQKPFKVFGGQHRIKAIDEASKKGTQTYHGLRIFFGLTVQQRVNIAIVNNTSITVSNDLLDRMQEDLLGSDLRNWCQKVSLLDENQNFADKRSPEGIPTVRIARTLIVNYYLGLKANKDELNYPIVCASGPNIDKDYKEVRDLIVWDDPKLIEMGKEFAKLHTLQRERMLKKEGKDFNNEFVNKAIHPCMVASWAFASGLFQNYADILSKHYQLSLIKEPDDPLSASVLSKARLKGTDPDTYRGLGARIGSTELGRMLLVFILQAETAKKRGINSKIALAAIQTFEAKRAVQKSEQLKKAIQK